MTSSGDILAEQWLKDTRLLFTRIEREAETVASEIAECGNVRRAERLRAEWSGLVGTLMEFSVSMSDLLPRVSQSSERKP